MSKTIWFAEYKELPQVWQQFTAWINTLLSENLWEEIEQLQQLLAGVDAGAYQKMVHRMQNSLPDKSMQALYHYGLEWHVW